MSKINVLSSKIFNRIAAGEVVERPASVVKELVENSLDAKAKNVTIEIQGGGLSFIKIIDDGVGIEKEDLKLAILPHATSKISKLSDLDQIVTLGFRGEALASVASVSKLSITSKPIDQELPANIYVEGGIINDVTDSAGDNGTEITVSNLFYNTPVRAKFLKSERSEENEITQTVSRFIMGNPDVSFKYVVDGKTVLQSYGDGLESAFVSVNGVDAIKNCFYIDTEKNGIKIKGYIGKHNFTKANRSYQTVFINGRFVVNQTVSSAISNAYSSYLMKRQYPFYVLSISIPVDAVDVNVHPNKTDVRFINNQIIYGSIYSVISKVLDGSSEIVSILSQSASQSNNVEKSVENKDEIKNNYITHNKVDTLFSPIVFNDSVKGESQKQETDIKPTDDAIFLENKAYLEKLAKEKLDNAQQKIQINKELKLIGQVLNTFLVLEDGESMYLIDQHAAHERLLFDKLNASLVKADVITQPLLIPYNLTVNALEYDFLIERLGALKGMGIEIDEFGLNTFKISSIPVILSGMNIDKFFNDVLSDLNSLKNISMGSLLMEKLAQKACKSAIKSGDSLSDNEIKALLDMLKGDLTLKCPHGRPIAVKITRTEIDKWFKRIV